jgi:hypothetical protein
MSENYVVEIWGKAVGLAVRNGKSFFFYVPTAAIRSKP